jgi:hypothetical protein
MSLSDNLFAAGAASNAINLDKPVPVNAMDALQLLEIR